MQLAPAIPPDCHQGNIGFIAPIELVPCLLQDVIDEPGAVFDQSADLPAFAKALVQRFPSLADGLLEGCDRARL
ncbi:hypothetical protein D3C77_764010 [compost metagenome]